MNRKTRPVWAAGIICGFGAVASFLAFATGWPDGFWLSLAFIAVFFLTLGPLFSFVFAPFFRFLVALFFSSPLLTIPSHNRSTLKGWLYVALFTRILTTLEINSTPDSDYPLSAKLQRSKQLMQKFLAIMCLINIWNIACCIAAVSSSVTLNINQNCSWYLWWAIYLFFI